MNDKLQLQEIVGYLPYGLKMTRNGFIGELISIKNDKNSIAENYEFQVSCSNWWENNSDINHYKPILRPLSDITKEIEVNGERFVPLRYLHTNVFMCDYPEFELTTDLEILINSPESQFNITLRDVNDMYQKLYQWHFDIHNLINRGLAIDINTLKNER